MIPGCRVQRQSDPDLFCGQPGWLFGLCWDHALYHVRRDWNPRINLYVTGDLANLHRLEVMIDEDAVTPEWVAVSWGQDGCDPVWMIQWKPRRSAWWWRRVADRRYRRAWRK